MSEPQTGSFVIKCDKFWGSEFCDTGKPGPRENDSIGGVASYHSLGGGGCSLAVILDAMASGNRRQGRAAVVRRSLAIGLKEGSSVLGRAKIES